MTDTEQKDGKGWGSGGLFGNRALGSLMLMLITPFFCLLFIHTCLHHHGSFISLAQEIRSKNIVDFILHVWPTPFDPYAVKIIYSFIAFELFLVKIVPGKEFRATVTASGHVPIYTANGVQCYLITILSLFAVAYVGFFKPGDIYDNLDKIVSTLNLTAIVFCTFLTVKGLNFPSTKDSGSNGNVIVDFFWGTELYPRVLGWDVKQCTNCRIGMMFWQVAILAYGFKQYDLLNGEISSSIVVSIVLQTIYIAKFFVWETGYFCSMDIQHDRAGYYICWGCLVWVPSMYTIHTFFMVEHPIALSLPVTIFLIAAGTFSIWANYDCDRYAHPLLCSLLTSSDDLFPSHSSPIDNASASAPPTARRRSGARSPTTSSPSTRPRMERNAPPSCWHRAGGVSQGSCRSLFLSFPELTALLSPRRHFHYVPEILAAFFWCVPTSLNLEGWILPLFYPIYLTLLLLDRAWRDDLRCSDKYTESWELYCKKVPYKIIPGVV
jgi:7-dehydrocholesterol reductase